MTRSIAIVFLTLLNVSFLFAQTVGYDKMGKFESGRAKVQLNGLCGIIDMDGNEIVTPKYMDIQSFKDRRAKVSLNKLCGIIDCDGKEIVPIKYERIGGKTGDTDHPIPE